jgi:hypothetical protein
MPGFIECQIHLVLGCPVMRADGASEITGIMLMEITKTLHLWGAVSES